MVLVINRKLLGDPLQCLNHNHAQLNRVCYGQPPREQSDDADMADPDSDRRRPRESLGEERETKRVRINVFGGEESDERVETEEEWVRIHRCPRRDLFSPRDSQGGPKLSDISKRRESIVCSTDGGERRIVDRWRDKESENRMHGETCRRCNKETPPSWLVQHALRNRCETPHHLLKKSLSSKLLYEQRVTFSTFDPLRSKARSGTSEIEKISAKFCG